MLELSLHRRRYTVLDVLCRVRLSRSFVFCFIVIVERCVDVFSPFAHGTESRINHLHSRQLRFKDLLTGELINLPVSHLHAC